MGTETLPPLCLSALGAVALLLAAGVIPWLETGLLLGVIAVFHNLPQGIKRLHSQRPVPAPAAKRAVARPSRPV